MSTVMRHCRKGVRDVPATSRSCPSVLSPFGNQRLDTDPRYWTTLTLVNAAVGSAYWIARNADLTDVLASGSIVSSDDLSIAEVPALANNELIVVRVRKGTSATRYVPFETYAYLQKLGTLVFVAQQVDTIAQ